MWFNVQTAYDYTTYDDANGGDAIPAVDFENVLDDMEVMQFTGLHDKNGKETYEGNIVIRRRKILVSWRDEESRFTNLDFANRYEVIGNIYESPELLK